MVKSLVYSPGKVSAGRWKDTGRTGYSMKESLLCQFYWLDVATPILPIQTTKGVAKFQVNWSGKLTSVARESQQVHK